MKEVHRPWGNFKQFALNQLCTVKILEISPHQLLSLQKHKKRVEEWYFLTDGYVQLGNKKIHVAKGRIVTIKKNQPHRLYAKAKSVTVLEISRGKFDEHDEIRLEDVYGRK
jgi:mannose-6-phosphate isomerase